MIRSVLASCGDDLAQGCLVSVQADRIRLRRLPVHAAGRERGR